MALEIFRLIGNVFVDTDKADKSLKKTDKSAEGLGHKLLKVGQSAGKFMAGVAGAASAAGAALVAVAESTREYRTEQGKLQTAFETANFTADQAKNTYRDLNGILGDSGQAVEAANHLAKLASSQEDLSKWTDICTGVYGTFGDSLPIEGLTEAANETAKVGTLTGSLADALNWAGVNEDDFQASLDACNSEQERQALITDTLNGLYSDAADKYREVNGEVINANMAQDRMNESMARVGAAVEPLITKGKMLLAEVFDKLTPAVEWVANTAVPWLCDGINQVMTWIGSLMTKANDSGVTFDTIMSAVQQLWTNTCDIIKNIWDTVGKPLWDAIMSVIGLVKDNFSENLSLIQDAVQLAFDMIKSIWDAVGQPLWDTVVAMIGTVSDYFADRMPAIQDTVRCAFDDIKAMWEGYLQPALQAIGDFLSNVLVPAFEWAFNNVIAPVVDTCFASIKDLWDNLLKPALEGILTFIEGVFTTDFTAAFQSIVDTVSGIWEGMISAVKQPINIIIGYINDFIAGVNSIQIPEEVPVVGGMSPNLPYIPYLRKGGVLEQGQVGLLEGTGAEAVVPLHENKKWIRAVADDMDQAVGKTDDRMLSALMAILSTLEDKAAAPIVLDTGALVGAMAGPMDRRLGQIQARKGRSR